MMRVARVAAVAAALGLAGAEAEVVRKGDPTVPRLLFDVDVKYLDGTPLDWSAFRRNKIFLIANVASECGFTEKGYQDLVKLDETFEGLLVLGAPCNDFGGQEPGGPEEIQQFVKAKGGKFPLLEKMSVNGPDAHMLFRFLKGESMDDTGCNDELSANECVRLWNLKKCSEKETESKCRLTCGTCTNNYEFFGDVKWNFEFFLVDAYGEVIERWPTGTDMQHQDVLESIRMFEEELQDLEEEDEYDNPEDHDEL